MSGRSGFKGGVHNLAAQTQSDGEAGWQVQRIKKSSQPPPPPSTTSSTPATCLAPCLFCSVQLCSDIPASPGAGSRINEAGGGSSL